MSPWVTVAIVAALLIGPWLGLLALELKTLTDKRPGNHVTVAVRRAFKHQPGVVVLLAFLDGFLTGAVMAHVVWP